MRIGIIGRGDLGETLAELFEDAGHDVRCADSGGGVEDACAFGEVVVLALPLGAVETLPADALEDTVVVDATNYHPPRDGAIAELDAGATTSSELVARHLEGARVVKALNTLAAQALAEEGTHAGDPSRLVVFVAGDDPDANRRVVDLADEIGFDAVVTGSLAAGGRLQQPGSPIHGAELTIAEAAEALRG